MDIKIFKKLALAGLLLGTYSITHTAAEKNQNGSAGAGNPSATQNLTKNLIEAARIGNIEAVRVILEGQSSSWSIALLSRVGIMSHLQDLEPIIDLINQRYNGTSPLIAAAEHGHTEIAQALLAAGATIDIVDNEGCTALYRAAQRGHTETVNALLIAGANPNHADTLKSTPLDIAIVNNHTEIARALITHGATVDKANASGETPLHIAALHGSTEIVQALIEAKAPLETSEKINNCTPLDLALRYRRTEVIRALITAGASINKPGKYLCWAATNGHTEIVHALLDAGAPADSEGFYNRPALYAAAAEGHTEIVRILLNAGATVNAPSEYGATALYRATVEGHTEIVQALLTAGAYPDVTDIHGDTALFHAASNGHAKVVQLLINAGATVNRENNRDQTPLDLAAENGHVDIVTTLINSGHQELVQKAQTLLQEKPRATISTETELSPLESLSAEIIEEQLAPLLDPTTLGCFRLASRTCCLHSQHERQAQIKEDTIEHFTLFIESALKLIKQNVASENHDKIAQLLQNALEKGFCMPPQAQLILCAAQAAEINSDDEGVAGPAPRIDWAFAQPQADDTVFPGCAISQQQQKDRLRAQQQQIEADRAIRAEQDAEFEAALAADQQRDRSGAALALALVAPYVETAAVGIVSQEKSEDEAHAPSLEDLRAFRLAALEGKKAQAEEDKKNQ